MTVLLTTRAASLLPPVRNLAGWHAAVAAEVTQHLTPAHAALLARPEPAPTGTAWIGPDGEWRRYADLPAADREKLVAAVAAIRSDIRRLAESGAAPAVTVAWPTLWTIPDLSGLFAVAGRPVLAGWSLPAAGGRAGAVLDRFDDGVSWRIPPRRPWTVYALTLGVLGLLALSAGLALPFLGLNLATPPAMCTADPGQLGMMHEQARAASDGDALKTQLAALTGEMGRRQLLCPIRMTQAPAPSTPPVPAPPPPTAPPRRADLPQDRWDRHDLSLLAGCWNLTTQLFVRSPNGPGDPVSLWRMCFGQAGQGDETEGTQSGRRCQGPIRADFEGDKLHITVPEQCVGPNLAMNPLELSCTRVGDAKADCQGRNLPGGSGFVAQFQR